MFKDILKKIADEYKTDQTYFGGDAEEDLCHSLVGVEIRPGMCRVPVSRAGYIHALYDLNIIEALPAPADGEVRVHADRAQAILDIVWSWEKPTSISYHVEYKTDIDDPWTRFGTAHTTQEAAVADAIVLISSGNAAAVHVVMYDKDAAPVIFIKTRKS